MYTYTTLVLAMCLCAPFGRDDKGSISHLYLFRFFFSTLFFLPLLAAEMIVIRREGGEWGGGGQEKKVRMKIRLQTLNCLKDERISTFFLPLLAGPCFEAPPQFE